MPEDLEKEPDGTTEEEGRDDAEPEKDGGAASESKDAAKPDTEEKEPEKAEEEDPRDRRIRELEEQQQAIANDPRVRAALAPPPTDTDQATKELASAEKRRVEAARDLDRLRPQLEVLAKTDPVAKAQLLMMEKAVDDAEENLDFRQQVVDSIALTEWQDQKEREAVATAMKQLRARYGPKVDPRLAQVVRLGLQKLDEITKKTTDSNGPAPSTPKPRMSDRNKDRVGTASPSGAGVGKGTEMESDAFEEERARLRESGDFRGARRLESRVVGRTAKGRLILLDEKA